jgi:hypothetical protein
MASNLNLFERDSSYKLNVYENAEIIKKIVLGSKNRMRCGSTQAEAKPSALVLCVARAMQVFWHILVAMCLAGCVIIPVPTDPRILEGRSFTDSDLEFVRSENVSRQRILESLGPPTIWLHDQRTLVYGLRRIEKTGAIWFIGAGLGAATGGLVEGETKEAVFFFLDSDDTITHWGRSSVGKGETWLSAALEWAQSRGLELPQPCSRFVEEWPSSEQSYVYFYRPRDYQDYLPLAPPAKKLPFGVANFVDLRLVNELVGQLRWRTYVVVRVPAGINKFVVDPDTDYVANPKNYRSATIQLDLAPGSVAFVEVGIKAGYGIIEPKLFQRTSTEALAVIQQLRESW